MAHFEYSSVIECSPEKVFNFLTNLENLPTIMPEDYKITFSGSNSILKKGAEFEMRISRYGISMAWGLLIEEIKAPEMFRDRQTHGPFSIWVHTHSVEAHSQGALLKDFIEYDVAFGLFGKLAQDLYIKRELERVFRFRHQRIQSLLK